MILKHVHSHDLRHFRRNLVLCTSDYFTQTPNSVNYSKSCNTVFLNLSFCVTSQTCVHSNLFMTLKYWQFAAPFSAVVFPFKQ